MLEQFVSRKEVVTPERAAIYREPFKVHGTSAAIGDWAYQFATTCESPRSQSVAGFAGLRPPLTLLWGEQDSVTPPEQARDIAAATPGARLVLLPGVGHIPQIEDPAQFNAQLRTVLNRSTDARIAACQTNQGQRPMALSLSRGACCASPPCRLHGLPRCGARRRPMARGASSALDLGLTVVLLGVLCVFGASTASWRGRRAGQPRRLLAVAVASRFRPVIQSTQRG